MEEAEEVGEEAEEVGEEAEEVGEAAEGEEALPNPLPRNQQPPLMGTGN